MVAAAATPPLIDPASSLPMNDSGGGAAVEPLVYVPEFEPASKAFTGEYNPSLRPP